MYDLLVGGRDGTKIQIESTVNYSYTGLGYTGIRTYRTENFSPAKTAYSMFCTVWYPDIPDP